MQQLYGYKLTTNKHKYGWKRRIGDDSSNSDQENS